MKKQGSVKRRLLVVFGLLFVVALVFDRFMMPWYVGQDDTRVVPNVSAMEYGHAVDRLRAAGFEAKKSFHVRYLNNVGQNVVLSQVPEAGTVVKDGRTVYLVVNREDKPSFPMPDLMGRFEAEARQEMSRINMVIDDVQVTVVGSQDENGRVLSQSIPPQTLVKPGMPLSVVVGRFEASPEGESKVVLPDLLGKSVAQAEQILEGAGLHLGTVKTEFSKALLPNTVIAQSPEAGAWLSPGERVALTVVIEPLVVPPAQ